MKNRLNWLLVIMIYLSVNGQVFAKAVHVCTEMAYTASALSSANTTINIHEHHQPIEPRKDNHQINEEHNTARPKAMDNCHCVDCDCVQNITGQANSSLLQDNSFANFFPVISINVVKLNRNFISLPYTNPYKPPITI
ncbi:hypothetical protein [Cognaticolwellia beringensis]|uniref:Uncharacterized protein n=1 Tax=Cognaticolwellia beringensis TaxID=1967665 RepID=A0A222GA50_9GAMM|nr:hypothetical protein [Cognaticolwellia beringensis]ASP48766.1 hypothetical protein B5D82_13925 [Cognaticolwellia beringensis]